MAQVAKAPLTAAIYWTCHPGVYNFWIIESFTSYFVHITSQPYMFQKSNPICHRQNEQLERACQLCMCTVQESP